MEMYHCTSGESIIYYEQVVSIFWKLKWTLNLSDIFDSV